jgi:hypothetical protein
MAMTVTLTFNGSISALYQPAIPHMLPALMNHLVMNVFKGNINLKPLHPWQKLELKPQIHWRVNNVTNQCNHNDEIQSFGK